MNLKNALIVSSCLFLSSLSAEVIRWNPETIKPKSIELKPGDEIILEAGTYSNFKLSVKGGGTSEEDRAIIKAEPLGSAKFIGETGIALHGQFITVDGLVFDGRPEGFDADAAVQIQGNDTGPVTDEKCLGGPADKAGVIFFKPNSRNCRLSNTFFSNFDYNYTGYEKGMNWVTMNGFENEVVHCEFEHKRSMNATIFIKPDPKKEKAGPEVPRNHSLHHNYFGVRNYIAKNGWETIRISDSSKQVYDLSCDISYNYFYRAIENPGSLAKEKEIISNKSRKNRYTYNVFDSCDGQITLRHGRDCVVENNWFLGHGRDGATGVRIIGTGHTVRENKFVEIDGIEYAATLTIMQGGYGMINNQYEGVENIVIAENIFLNCEQPINFAYPNGRGELYDDMPRNLTVVANKILSDDDDQPMFVITEDLTTTGTWLANEYYNTKSQDNYGDVPAEGWVENKELKIKCLGEPPITAKETGPIYRMSLK